MQYLKLGQFIKTKRLALDKSLNKFAFEAEIDPAILSRIENGKQDIKFNILCKIASAFELLPSKLLEEFEHLD